jgi:hypothetical protein
MAQGNESELGRQLARVATDPSLRLVLPWLRQRRDDLTEQSIIVEDDAKALKLRQRAGVMREVIGDIEEAVVQERERVRVGT